MLVTWERVGNDIIHVHITYIYINFISPVCGVGRGVIEVGTGVIEVGRGVSEVGRGLEVDGGLEVDRGLEVGRRLEVGRGFDVRWDVSTAVTIKENQSNKSSLQQRATGKEVTDDYQTQQ